MGYFLKDTPQKIKARRLDYISFAFNQKFSYKITHEKRLISILITPIQIKETNPKKNDLASNNKKQIEKLLKKQGFNPDLSKKTNSTGQTQEKGSSAEEKKVAETNSTQGKDADKTSQEARERQSKEKAENALDHIKTARAHTENFEKLQKKKDKASPEEKVSSEKKPDAAQQTELGKEKTNPKKSTTASTDKKKPPQPSIPSHLEKTKETDLLIPKNSARIADVIKAVKERQKDMLFFNESQDLKNQLYRSKRTMKKRMKKIVKEMKKYTPLLQSKVKQLSLDECIQISINNHLPAQIALEKIKLAKLKYWEARRNLFPKLSTNLTKTKGEADTLPFIEKNYKLSLDHTVFDGGAVKFLLEQSKINLEITKRTFDKIKSELTFEVEESYYNFLMAKMNMSTQRCLFENLKELLKKIEYLAEEGLIKDLDLRNVQSSYNQVEYQLAGTLKDYKMGELSLRQKMGVDQNFPLKIVDSIGFKDMNIDLNDALWLAYKSRPEYIVNKLMVEFKNYDRLAHIAKEGFSVDFSGSYGYGGSAYQDRVLKLKEQWNASLKVSKTLGGNTLESNVIREQAFPRLGQSSRGKSYTRSIKFSLLDNLKIFTHKKQADITFQESLLELGKIEKQIETDVRNAYYDYQKSIIQIDSAFHKIMFRQKELEVNEKMTLLGEGSLVGLVDSQVRLADEKSFYYQGLINYYVAIANMNKGIGLIGYYR